MKRLSKFFLAALLLTVASVSWAACPSGYKNNYKGECVRSTGKTSTPAGKKGWSPDSNNQSSGSSAIWCVHNGKMERMSQSSCNAKGGTGYKKTSDAKKAMGKSTEKVSVPRYGDAKDACIAHATNRSSRSSFGKSTVIYVTTTCSNRSKMLLCYEGIDLDVCNQCGFVAHMFFDNQDLDDEKLLPKFIEENPIPVDSCRVVDSSNATRSTTPTTPVKPVEPTKKVFKIVVRADGGSYVYINGNYQGTAPVQLEMSKGRHKIRVTKSGYYDFERTIDLQRDSEIYASLTKKEQAKPEPKPEPEKKAPSAKLAGTGTAFVVSKNYLLTAAHVIDECREVTIRHAHEEIAVAIADFDKSNDLGLLKSKKSFEHTAKLRDGKPLRLGDTVVNYGYPLFGDLSNSAKISKGEINSLAGMGNDSGVFQYDASTQPGNSGGPVLDLSGNVVGVVSHRYSEEANVNFAVKSNLAEGFLSANSVDYERAESTEEMKTADIAEKAERFTVLVGCWQ